MERHEYEMTAREVHTAAQSALNIERELIGALAMGRVPAQAIIDRLLEMACEMERIRNAARYNAIVAETGKRFGERVD